MNKNFRKRRKKKKMSYTAIMILIGAIGYYAQLPTNFWIIYGILGFLELIDIFYKASKKK